MKKGIKDALLKEFDGQIRESLQEETRIINRAKLALKKLEKELSKPSQSRIYSSMCSSKVKCNCDLELTQVIEKCWIQNLKDGTTNKRKEKKPWSKLKTM